MRQYVGIYLLQNHSLHVSDVHRTHYKENINLLLQPLVQVIVCVQQPSSNVAIGHFRGRLLLCCYYDLYQRLQL